jgi:hypothetical protein
MPTIEHPAVAGSFVFTQPAKKSMRSFLMGTATSETLTPQGPPSAIVLASELFVVTTVVGEGVYVAHQTWSLVGRGNDLQGALKDLFDEMRDVRSSLNEIPPEELAIDAKSLLAYLNNVFP